MTGSVAILGGTGFIGAALAGHLAERGRQFVSVSRSGAPGPTKAHHIGLDLAEAPATKIAEVLREHSVGVVVNAAGGMWGLTDEQMYRLNVALVERVIEAIRLVEPAPRLVQLGTVHEYGLAPTGQEFTERSLPQPVMEYGRLKLRCTEAVSQAAAGGLDAVTLRIGNVVGRGQPTVSLLGAVADQLVQAARAGAAAALRLGSLGSRRDFVGLNDVLQAIDAATTVGLDGDRVINIGSGAAISARTLVRLLIDKSAVPTELIEAAATGPEETWQQLNITLAERILGFRPAQGLDREIEQLWAWRLESE